MAALFLGAAGAVAPAYSWEMRVCADPNYMPFSKQDLSGYDNKIAQILADELGAELTFVWFPQTPNMISDQLREGNCDMILGVPESNEGLLPTIAYYRSPYTFVYRADSGYDISSFDDEVLKTLKFGVQVRGDSPHGALAKRGLAKNVVSQAITRDEANASGPFSSLIEQVASGDIDVAIPWGPVGGYYASQQKIPLKVVSTPEFELPFTPMYITVVIAVRQGDDSLRDRLDIAIANRWDDINAVLKDYGVPTLDLPQPTVTIGGQ
ncbi:MAG TPA: quinoprotein dehydrogenase-associated putative ABC transporter substrate-binding protein [Devosia sp.]|nr:quinoprotein dehydrogenase-associated putative ABC transporter substrate-binding protein [Devosia sp.]